MILALLAMAIGQVPAAPSGEARVAALNERLEQHDSVGLARLLNSAASPAEKQVGLGWERDTMIRGSSAIVAFRYAGELWQVAEAQKDDGLRQTASLAALYAFAATEIDGKRCKDVSAPGHRIEQFAPVLRPIVQYIRGLPLETRRKLVSLTATLDARTANAQQRREDWFLCSGGLDEIQYGLAHGTQRLVPTPPGHIGDTVVVDAPGYRPAFLPEHDIAAAIAAERAKLPQLVGQLAGL